MNEKSGQKIRKPIDSLLIISIAVFLCAVTAYCYFFYFPGKNERPQISSVSEGFVKAAASDEKININTADQKRLEKLPGIGPVRANAIIEYRKSNGGFKTIEDILKVKGIGPKIFEKLKSLICIDDAVNIDK